MKEECDLPSALNALFLVPQDIADLPDPVPGVGENRLEHAYSLWFTQRTRGSVSTALNYEENIMFVGSFSTVCTVVPIKNLV